MLFMLNRPRLFYALLISSCLAGLYFARPNILFAEPDQYDNDIQIQGSNSIQIIEFKSGRFFNASSQDSAQKYGLLGIYAPTWNELESELRSLGATKKEMLHAKIAAKKGQAYLKKNIRRNDVLNITSQVKQDFIGRKLVIVVLPNHKPINLEMLRMGYAYPLWTELDSDQKKQFKEALQVALKNKKGLWKVWESWHKKETSFATQTKKLSYHRQRKVTLMTYNLENLFDTKDSPDTKDYAYLPLSAKQNAKHKELCNKIRSKHRKAECLKLDWHPERLKIKMERLAQVIKKVNHGRGPDLLYLQEVENYSILKRLRDQYLGFGKYQIIHFESRDRRGIDVALLSRLGPASLARYHEIDFNRYTRTRGILHAPLYLPDKKILHAFVFHFPSQGAPIKMRKQALVFLSLLKNSLGKGALAVAAGDCNITKSEEKKLYPRYLRPFWKVSHYLGCKGCSGSSYYPPKKSWSFFDVFYSSLNLTNKSSPWQIKPSSVRVFTPLAFQKTKKRTPNAYRQGNFSGVSDHWPVLLEIVRSR